MKEIRLPETCLVLLVGPSSSGKSTFAKKNFLPTEVISSDYCRALISDDENDLSVTQHAFEVLHYIAAKRLKMGKLTVIDALNIRKEDRAKLIRLAKDNYALPAAIVIESHMKELLSRHEGRTDRHFSQGVLVKQYEDFKHSLRTIEKEGLSYVYYVEPENEVRIIRQKLYNNKKEEIGPFDIIGDIHGCITELLELIQKLGYSVSKNDAGHYTVQHPLQRKLVFLGDLVDRGIDSPEVLRLVMDIVKTGHGYCVGGNHDEKLNRFLAGKNVNMNHGFDKTVQQLESTTKEFRQEIKEFLYHMHSHYVFDEGRLVVAHAGLPEEMHGKAAGAVRAFAHYGETTGEIDEFGLPVRYNWARNYKGKALVVYGHTPIPEPEWLNNTINIDTGCVYGGKLTALRYPERELVSVGAKIVYSEPIRPIQSTIEPLSAQQEFDDLLDIDIISGKKLIETRFGNKVIIREENAIAALEVMSRFAIDPKWLIYLPPTMSPPETSKRPDFLEHPQEVFDYYLKNGVTQVICEEKHMGSRAIVVVCKDPNVAVRRFGLLNPALGTIYTRTGRRFFDEKIESAFLQIVHEALSKSDFWSKFNTEWVCLDAELMPWNAKAKDLLIKQYAALGAAGKMGLAASRKALQKAKTRGIEVEPLQVRFAERSNSIESFTHVYRQYCREVNGIEGLVLAPFHLLAVENHVFYDKQHTWHLEQIREFCQYNEKHLMITSHLLVDLLNDASAAKGVEWWNRLTGKGGEGMVVKPLDYLAKVDKKVLQPAMKCRGKEYLRLIYGPEYDLGENLMILKDRNVKAKRDLALREFTLGLEGLERFVHKEPLSNVHECAFGVLAQESEAVDPRL